ncbi:hypothetical protein FRB99_003043 [Tulasnella sp. 403]|nr:hypothetical protein FRB99_003043 [Tulasnella sp. 403]
MLISTLLTSTLLLGAPAAAVTVYTAKATTAAAAAAATYTAASTDQTILQPPNPPQQQNANVAVQLYDGGMTGMGLPVPGSFWGFSIELSVAAMLMGENGGVLRPEFLNYCAVLESRAGGVTIRVGGNTQDKAILNIDGNPSGKTIDKYKGTDASPTETPDVHFTLDLFKAMAAITNLVKVQWFFGIPFINVDADGNAGLVMQNSMSYLGSSLLGLQLANEPDLYGPHLKKSANYSVTDFFNDTSTMIQRLPVTQPIIVGPSPCCMWTIDDLLNDGYMDQFSSSLKFVDVMHYPNNNCATGTSAIVPQNVFANYLTHTGVQGVISPYFNAANRAVAAGKQFMMMETNTASCGGFPGVSDSFGAALWGVDYALQMAYGNFTYALVHFGGQNVYYNPFTPPPTNMTSVRQWTTGAIFYSHIVVAEALGKSNQARVMDLSLDGNNPNRAGYAIYENGVASRVVLINYVSNPGASDYTAQIAIGGGQTGLPSKTPTSVKVKYLRADTVSEKYNITWAGQNMGQQFKADGRLYGDAQVDTVNCDPTAGTCSIPVPAPCVALVFLTDEAYQNSGGLSGDASGSTLTFATTTTTGKVHPTIDTSALQTSNGRSGADPLGTTSKNTSVNAAVLSAQVAWTVMTLAVGVSAAWVLML